MLSLLSAKPLAKDSNISHKDILPKIVDFNTIEEAATMTVEAQKPTYFSLWPFGRSRASAAKSVDDAATTNASLLDDSTDKVIAMKKIDSSLLNEASLDNDNDAEANDLDEDFIDIQLRQLSYAEVAALNNARSATNHVASNVVVIDQEDALGKSITDLEMVKSFKNHEKFDIDSTIAANQNAEELSPEDQWDIYVEGKTPKKASHKKAKKAKKRSN